MNKLLRIGWALCWRFAVSRAVFYDVTFAAGQIKPLRGLPVSWVLALRYSYYTFCLLAFGLAIWAALDPRGRRGLAVAGTSLVYTAATMVLCGAWAGSVDRPYLFLCILGNGVAGLVAPWVVQVLVTRAARGHSQTDKLRAS